MPLGFRKHIINAKNSQEELKVHTDSAERLNNFDRRLSARNLDKFVQKREAVINRDFATIRPRGLPTDLLHKEGQYVYQRKVSIEQQDMEDGDEARLPPFAPFRTASDTDNLHLLPATTEKRAYLYLIDQETDINQVKLQNADIIDVDTQNAIRKRAEQKRKKKSKKPKKKKKPQALTEPEVSMILHPPEEPEKDVPPEEAAEPPPEELIPPPEEEIPEEDVPEEPPQEDQLEAQPEEVPQPPEEPSPSEESPPPEKPLPSGKAEWNSSRSPSIPRTLSSRPPGIIPPFPVSSSPTPSPRRSQRSHSSPSSRYRKPSKISKKRSPSSSSYSYSSSPNSSSSSGSDPDFMKLMLQMMMMENMGGMGGMGGGQAYPSPQYGQPPPPPYCQPPLQYCQPPPCPPKKKKKKKNRCLNKPINVAKKNRGLNFDFLPEEDCCTEITVTIDPDEEDPLECAMDNGVMPIVCCYVPPQLAQTCSPGFQCYQCQYPQQGGFQNGDCGQNKTPANGRSASNSQKAKDSSLKEIVPPNPNGGSGSHSYTYAYPSDIKSNTKP